MANGDTLRKTTGQLDFSGGIDSDKTPTISGLGNPNGLRGNQLAFLNNGTVRGGGISPRAGWKRLLEMPVTALFQCAYMYRTDGFPYIVALIRGRLYRIRVDLNNQVDDISGSLTMPADEPLGFMVQGEEFLVVQAGDYKTLPLFWDGSTLRRSLGQNTTQGIVAANFVVPAVGQSVLVTLTAPFVGTNNSTVQIGGKNYTAITHGNSIITAKNLISNGSAGTYPVGFTVPAGTQFYRFGGPAYFVSVNEFVVPAVGATVDITTSPTLAITALFGPNPAGADWFEVTALGLPEPGVNQVYLVNIDDTPGNIIAAGTELGAFPELPAAGPMDYYMGRIWLANGREYIAGDIVGGPSGSQAYQLRDSILKTEENTYISLGGTFTVPDLAGNIRALKHPVTLDTALGEGQLFVFTSERVYSVNVVPTRAAWKTLSEPIQRVAQINFGSPGDRSVVGVNGDLFFRSLDGVRSMTQAIRYFEQWGNISISVEEERVVEAENREFLKYSSSILFNNRVLFTCLPQQTDIGVIFKGLMPISFDTISTLAQKLPPAWEGVNEGLDILHVLNGDFGGLVRSFAFVRSATGKLELWELTLAEKEDTNLSGDARIQWVVETPAFTWGAPFELKELDTLELWIDRLFGTVDFYVDFRPDQHPCWEFWHAWQVCAPRNDCEDVGRITPCDYPTQTYRQQYRATMILPKPPTTCEVQNARPINIGYQFQFRIRIRGYCRIRGILAHALPRMKAPYEKIVCADGDPSSTPIPMRTIGQL